jgi:hypothetical protein
MVVSISFKEIYTKAIGLFDDPKITVAYENNLVQFCKLMSSFLTTSISLFNNPIVVAEKLSNFKPPQGQTEIFISDGETKTYTLSEEFDLKENSICTYIAKDKIVEGKLDKENKTVTFPDVLPKGEELLFEQYILESLFVIFQ